jgi:quercetin dioxygenase-like cupin family protein
MSQFLSRVIPAIALVSFLHASCATKPVEGEESVAARPTVTELIKASESWDGARLPAYPRGQPEITILRISIPPGARLDLHHHPVINAGVLLSGELTVTTASGKTKHLKAGDPLIELVHTPHAGMNPGKTPSEVLVFYAGRVNSPITVGYSAQR